MTSSERITFDLIRWGNQVTLNLDRSERLDALGCQFTGKGKLMKKIEFSKRIGQRGTRSFCPNPAQSRSV